MAGAAHRVAQSGARTLRAVSGELVQLVSDLVAIDSVNPALVEGGAEVAAPSCRT